MEARIRPSFDVAVDIVPSAQYQLYSNHGARKEILQGLDFLCPSRGLDIEHLLYSWKLAQNAWQTRYCAI